jgi:hypothetical protein
VKRIDDEIVIWAIEDAAKVAVDRLDQTFEPKLSEGFRTHLERVLGDMLKGRDPYFVKREEAVRLRTYVLSRARLILDKDDFDVKG